MSRLEEIRRKLAEGIKQSVFTQAEIADRLGIKQSLLNRYLTGSAMPALDTFANLCKLLGLDTNEILCIAAYKNDLRKENSDNSLT